jgi:hypothetical protein
MNYDLNDCRQFSFITQLFPTLANTLKTKVGDIVGYIFEVECSVGGFLSLKEIIQLIAKKKTRKEKFPNVNLILDNTYQIIFKNMNFDVNSNLSLVKRFHSHYEKLVKMYQFYSDSSRFFFATNCNNMVNDSCEKFNVLLRAKKVGRHC